jgi:nucleotide sugar dehydrogenase
MAAITLKNRSRVAVVGLGYVGLALCSVLSEAGHEVAGIDSDLNRVRDLNSGRSPILDLSKDQLAEMLARGFRATENYSVINSVGTVVIALPTPTNSDFTPDLSPLVAGIRSVTPHLHSSCLVVVESTVGPGDTRNVVLRIMQEQGKKLGDDFLLAFSPERIDPGGVHPRPTDVPKIVAGVDDDSLISAQYFYERAGFVTVQSNSVEAAEAAKLLENTYRAVNLALVNHLAPRLSTLGVDIGEVIRLAATKPFGFQAFYPGAGVGGHCIPVDAWYLEWATRRDSDPVSIVSASLDVNDKMPTTVALRIREIAKEASSNGEQSKIALLGMTYKPNVADFRNAPGLRIIEKLHELGHDVGYHDPFLESPLSSSGTMLTDKLLAEWLEAGCLVFILQLHAQYARSPGLRAAQVFNANGGKDQFGVSIWATNKRAPGQESSLETSLIPNAKPKTTANGEL